MQPGNSMQRWVDAAGQLNSILDCQKELELTKKCRALEYPYKSVPKGLSAAAKGVDYE
jgi:hypothetical protein